MKRSTMTAAAVLGTAATLCTGCSSNGTMPPQDTGGPVQDLQLTGSPALHLGAATNPMGASSTAPGPHTGTTGCYSWTDTDGAPHWAARITGDADGHSIELDLSVNDQSLTPQGTHTTSGAVSTDGVATLTVAGVAYPGVYVDPSDAVPSYFTIDADGTTGLISIRFAASAGAPQAYLVAGRWACA